MITYEHYKPRCVSNTRQNFFVHRVINIWNSLTRELTLIVVSLIQRTIRIVDFYSHLLISLPFIYMCMCINVSMHQHVYFWAVLCAYISGLLYYLISLVFYTLFVELCEQINEDDDDDDDDLLGGRIVLNL